MTLNKAHLSAPLRGREAGQQHPSFTGSGQSGSALHAASQGSSHPVSQQALADKLDRLAMRLQQMSSPSGDFGHPSAPLAPDQDNAPKAAHGASPDYRHPDHWMPAGHTDPAQHDHRAPKQTSTGFDESHFDRYTEAFDPGRAPHSARSFHPAPQAAYSPVARDPARQVPPNREDRRAQNRRAVPTAEDIGRAVEDMRAAAQSASPPVAPQAGQIPSSKGIPKRRKSDWSAQARMGRRHTDYSLDDLQAHNAQSHNAPSPVDPKTAASVADLEELRADLAEIHRSVRETAPHHRLNAIETGLGETIQRLDDLSHSLQDPGKSQRLERRVDEMAHVLASMPPVQDVHGLEQRIAHLAQRFEESISAGLHPAAHGHIAASVQDLQRLIQTMDPNQIHQRLEQRLQELGANIAAVESVARDARGYAADLYDTDRSGMTALGERLFAELSTLRTQLADADQAGTLRVVQGQIDVLSQKIDLIDANHASDSNRGFERLESALGHLSAELPHIQNLAQGIQQLEHQIAAVGQNMTGFAASDGGANLAPVEERLARLEDSARFIGEAVTNNTTEARLAQLSQQLVDLSQHLRTGNEETAALITRSLQGVELGARQDLDAADLEQLKQRMDEIHTLVGSNSQSDQLAQIQTSLTQLVNTLGVDLRQQMLDRLETQIGRLGDRVEGLTDIDTLTRMETTVRKLSGVFETSDRFDRLMEVEGRLSTVVDRFEQASPAASAQDISDLQAQIADIRAHLTSPSDQQSAVEAAMAALTARLDQVAERPTNEAQLIERLEAQMNAVADRFATTGPATVDFSPLEQRLLDIERHLESPQAAASADTIELARMAARDAVREVAQEMAAQQENEPDPVVEELRAQIGALQAANEQGRTEHSATLHKVSQSLDEILTRLDGPTADLTEIEPSDAPHAQSGGNQPYTLNEAEIAAELPDFNEFEPLQPSGLDTSSSEAQARLAAFDAQLAQDQGLADHSQAPAEENLPSPSHHRADESALYEAAEDFTPQRFGHTDEIRSDDGHNPMMVPASDPGSPSPGGVRRESVSDLRARLFGGTPEGEAKGKPAHDEIQHAQAAMPAPMTQPAGQKDDTKPGRRWGWGRNKKPADKTNAPFEPEVDLIGADPTLDLDQSSRPDANMLSSEFQPLSPGERPRYNQGEDLAETPHTAARARQTVAGQDPAGYETAQPKSLLGRLGGLVGRKSGPVAVSAGAALLVAGSFYLHKQVENDQLTAFLSELAGEQTTTVAQQPVAIGQSEAVTASVSVAEHSAGDEQAVDPTSTASLKPKSTERVTLAMAKADDYIDQRPAVSPGMGDGFSLQPEPTGLSTDHFTKPGAQARLETGAASKAANQILGRPIIEDHALEGQVLNGTDRLKPVASRPVLRPDLANLGTEALQIAAMEGNSDAEFQIGYLLLTGHSGEARPEDAVNWFEKSAAQDHAPAQFQLGLMHKHGRGTPQDKATAQIWFKRAAENGNVMAMHALAVSYSEGAAGPPNYGAAATWFERAANHGVKDSQFNIGLIYARGLGTEQDLASSYKWFALAARQGDRDAGEKRDAIASKLNRQELASAKLAAETFERTQPDMVANRVNILPEWQADAPDLANPKAKTAASTTAPDSASQTPNLVPSELLIKETQRLLGEQGYDTGGIDGQLGPKTTAAIRSFQRDSGMEETGIMSPSLLRQLLSTSG